ncbi:reverse transcriptase domain-containing protein [Tanacetum coccineum]
MLVAPKPKEELIIYMSASYGAVSVVLMNERGTVQTPVYFISRALQGPELNYTPMEKLVLSLVFSAKRLRRYFQAHPIAVITDQQIKQIISRPDVAGRLQKWSVMLGEHNITYLPRTSVKGQIMADFLVEKPNENPPDTPVVETPPEPWTLFMDGSSCVDGSGASEYEALIAGLRIAARMDVWNVQVSEDFKLVANQVLGTVGRWTLPGERKEASKLRIKARQYELLEGVLYKRSFLKPWLRCVGPLQAKYVIREIHEGSCSMHAGPRFVVAKAMRLGYYWPTMHRDAREMIRPGNVKFLIVAMDYFTKWIEAKAVVTITGNQRFALVKHLQSNGLVERVNQSLGEGIKIVCAYADERRLNLDLLEAKRERQQSVNAKAKIEKCTISIPQGYARVILGLGLCLRSNDASGFSRA